MINPASKPYLHPYIYIDSYRKRPFLLHPFTDKKIIFIKPFEKEILLRANGQKTIKDLYSRIVLSVPKMKITDLVWFFTWMSELNVVYFKQRKKKAVSKHWFAMRVWFHVTNQCNLRCKSCYVHKTPHRMALKTGYRALEDLFISAKKNHYRALNIRFNGGEPLLEIDNLIRFANHCKKLQGLYTVKPLLAVITNGVLLNENTASRLQKAGIVVVVSLDGIKKQNDQNRCFANGRGSFDYAVRAIKTAQKYNIFRCVSVTVTSKNVIHLPKFISYLTVKGIPFFLNFYRTPIAGHDPLIPSNNDLIRSLKKTYTFLKKHPSRLAMFSTTLDLVFSPCGVGYNQTVIDWTGEIKECQMFSHIINRKSKEDVLSSIRKSSFTKRYHTLLAKTPCGSCKWKYICGSGCSVMHYAQLIKSKKLLPPSYCETYKTLIPLMIKTQVSHLEKNTVFGYKKSLIRAGYEDSYL
ncbi:MAG: radical SAM protein [Patescibacteria group bacterium]